MRIRQRSRVDARRGNPTVRAACVCNDPGVSVTPRHEARSTRRTLMAVTRLPLQFHPLFRRYRWGGRRLATVLNKPIGDDTCAESWEVVDHGDDQSVVLDGPFAGKTLHELVVADPHGLVGRPARQFPLLVKFLDAADRLSVQVHPDDERAKQFDPNENGKTEAWLIIDADPGSCLYVGLREGVDEATLRRAVAEKRIAECLHRVPIRAGDCVLVPAGTVHAIGEGILLAEIQQSSDLTFRLYDWDRLDRDGRPRPLHIEESFACIDFARGPVDPVQPVVLLSGDSDGGHTVERLCECPYFEMRRHTAAVRFTLAPEGVCRIVQVVDGLCSATVTEATDETATAPSADWNARRLPRGQTFLIPAAGPSVEIEPLSEVVLLETLVR
ncbi:MAG: class I mannose-6-phosphate isomerase [Planctomycetota bacterium]|nr:MAG: class I mannose-6-phosphate isomerase [Planctomycetota bacterium]